jgi:glycosyltransferase involved in cell wall biosynthesis
MQKFLKFNRYIGDSLKICMISFSNIHGGNATRILNLAKNLSDKFNLEIIFDGDKCNHVPQQFKTLNITFTPYLHNLYLTLSYGIIDKIAKCMKKYDIIHCFKPLPSSYLPSLIISKVKKARIIIDWDDWEGKGGFAEFDPFFLRDFLDWFQILSIKNANAVTVATPFLERIAKRFNQKVYLIPNGADITSFVPTSQKSEIKKKFNCFLIVYVGLLYKACDVDIVIKAMKYVTQKVDAKLIIVGDGPRKKEFIELARMYKLDEKVIFVGYKSRKSIPEFINAADIVVLPMKDNLANRARSPVKLGEYLACGKPIVASNVGIAKEIIKNYYNGILTSNHPEKFAEAIVRLLEDENLRKKIEKNARKTAEKRLDWKIIAKRLENVYNDMMNL